MQELNLPSIKPRLEKSGDTIRIYDPLRDKWLVLTPEEWVRQHFVSWLVNQKGYPVQLIANEIGIKVNSAPRRCDTVIFGKDMQPLVIIEYKAPEIQITQSVFDQIVRYNMALRARYLVVSNGMDHYCCKIDYASNTYHFIPTLPEYAETSLPFSEQ